MRTPPWLMACALLFWGWENGLLMWGWMMAAILEGSRFSRTRWEFSDTDLNRICNLSWWLCVGSALLVYSEDRTNFIFRLAQYLPFCLFPLALGQAYGHREKMPLTVFWWLLRRSPNKQYSHKAYNISYCYFAVCVMAASSATSANLFFYSGVTLLVAWALTASRPRRVSNVVWVGLLALVAVSGYFSHTGLRQLQSTMEERLGIWIASLFRFQQQDSRECPTQIGSPGRLALSGKIIFRVRAESSGYVPGLLREQSWDNYQKEIWSTTNLAGTDANPGMSDTIKLLPTNVLSSEVEIAGYYPGGSGVLALPHGTFEIWDLPCSVKTNSLGVARIDQGPGLVDFRASFGPGRSLDSPPNERDLSVDYREAPTLSNIVAELKLKGMKEQQKVRAVHRFFSTNFIYTLDPPRHQDKGNATWLSYFLTKSHRGHCQYFATATVLLLRQAGVCARYVTGYAVPESAKRGDTYLVRERDAHAWALVYNSDMHTWEQVDNTPSDWDKADTPPWWEPASDEMSGFFFQFSKWRWDRTSYARYSSWLLAPVVLYLIGRIIFSQRRKKLEAAARSAVLPPWPGLDSELFLINRQLAEAQLSRLPNEPLRSWQDRLERAFPGSDRLRRIFHLHRRLRFDPHGLRKDDRETLRSESNEWLAEFTAQMEQRKRASIPAPQ